jgi:hypothetical protein
MQKCKKCHTTWKEQSRVRNYRRSVPAPGLHSLGTQAIRGQKDME